MEVFKRWNNILGWAAFAVSLIVYTLTLEPTASFWDCGEFLSAADKLQVVHPPGATLFLLLGKVFSLLAFGDQTKVAFWMNMMSATTSALTVLFVFWTITHLARKIMAKNGEMESGQMIAILGAGLVGALALTFSDTFWFSAVEAEVYASSCFFTAVSFWCVLKWEDAVGSPRADRWLVLIAYLIGLAIGVHLLNLLVIPAVVFIYYFKKYQVTTGGFILTLLIAALGIVLVQNIIIPQIPNLGAKFDLLFVNKFHLPFYSGLFFFLALLTGGIVWGLWYTKRTNRAFANTLILCFAFIVMGFTSYTMVFVRSIANVPLDHQNVEDPYSMLSYLNRDQYGDWPLLKGQYYTARMIDTKPGAMQYRKGDSRYEETTPKPIYVWEPDQQTVFPRMWSNRADHVDFYKKWERVGEGQKPTFGKNIDFLFSYQLGFMYWRYFLWNFVGRQSDEQGNGELTNGNWLSGITFIDEARLGPQENLPENLKSNKGRNTYYFLPLLLGILGLVFHFRKSQKDFFVVLLLFLFTGAFIVLYLNFPPLQPRERDYAYVGSFQTFCIWIGFGALAIFDFLRKRMNGVTAASTATAVSLFAAPILMGSQNWDDHDRSNRYTARDFAIDYLESCAPNAVLFTNGDNDTYPLWYAQNVEAIRTDVRVINLSLLNTDWYADVMKRPVYNSAPIPFELKSEQYVTGKRDYVFFYANKGLISQGFDPDKYVNLKSVIDFIAREDGSNKTASPYSGELEYYYPVHKFSIPVDKKKVLANGTVQPEDEGLIVDSIKWDIGEKLMMKNDLIVLDFIANNNWDRPVYFTITTGNEAYIGMEDYFQLEGLTYRLVPISVSQSRIGSQQGETGRINTRVMMDNLLNKFKWGGMDREGPIYLDGTILRQTKNLRNICYRLGKALLAEGKKEDAIKVCDFCLKVMPHRNVPFDVLCARLGEIYIEAGAPEKAEEVFKIVYKEADEDLKYYQSFKGKVKELSYEIENCQRSINYITYLRSDNFKKDIGLIKELPKQPDTTKHN